MTKIALITGTSSGMGLHAAIAVAKAGATVVATVRSFDKAGELNETAAKAGVTGLTKTIAKEWGRYNVTVNTVAFGLITTRLTEAPAGGDGGVAATPIGHACCTS